MIVALTGMEGNGAVADLAEELALLRVAAGNRVLLVSPNPGAYDPQLYDDLVIDASCKCGGTDDTAAGKQAGNQQADNQKADNQKADNQQASNQYVGNAFDALARAGVIVALLRLDELERHHHTALLERLSAARQANPCARLLVTVAHGSKPLSAHQTGCLLVFVAQLPGARLADTLVLDEHGDYHSHHSELERDAYKTANVLCAPEVRHLYREVFSQRGM